MNSKKPQMISSRKEIKEILEKGKHFSGKYLKFIYVKKSYLEPHLKLFQKKAQSKDSLMIW